MLGELYEFNTSIKTQVESFIPGISIYARTGNVPKDIDTDQVPQYKENYTIFCDYFRVTYDLDVAAVYTIIYERNSNSHDSYPNYRYKLTSVCNTRNLYELLDKADARAPYENVQNDTLKSKMKTALRRQNKAVARRRNQLVGAR